MKNVNKILAAVSFIAIIALLVAFTSIDSFIRISYGWQCALCGFLGLLCVACLLIEAGKTEA